MLTYSDIPFDVIHHLCSMIWATSGKDLFTLSVVDRRTRSACIPMLFKEVIIGWKWESASFDRFVANVEGLLANEGIKKVIKSLHFRPWGREAFPIPSQFFDLLFSLPSLSDLAIILELGYLTQVQKEFQCLDNALPRVDAKFLPKLQSLSISSPEWIFIAECCPNLTSLNVRSSTRGRWPGEGLEIDIVRLGKSHPNLKSLHCAEIGLTRHVNEIAENLPQIQDLGLYGRFRERNNDDGNNDDGLSVMDHLKAYHTLKHLRHLSLPSASGLGMGFSDLRCVMVIIGQPNPQLAEMERHRHEVIHRLMDGISSEVIARQGSTLCDVTVGEYELWEIGEDGRLFASKRIERSQITQKIIAMTTLEKRPLDRTALEMVWEQSSDSVLSAKPSHSSQNDA